MSQSQRPTTDQQLIALGRILQTLREEENVDVLIETTISYLKDEFDYSLIWIGLYDRLDHRLFGKGGRTPKGDDAFLKQRFALNPGDLLEQVVIQQRPVGVPDLRAEPRAGEWRRFAQVCDIQGTILFPIRYKDRCYGTVLLGSPRWGVSPKADEKARLSMILGELGSVLCQIELSWQYSQTKRPDGPLLRLLEKLCAIATLEQRLEEVVEETHEFIAPARTNIYWFERQRRYFWRRVSNRLSRSGLGEINQSAAGITVAEVSEFYQALSENQIVSIGSASSSLKAGLTGKLLQRIRARSLLAAPILVQNELLGFLAVEGASARIWAEEEKNYLRGAAELVALIAPLETMEKAIAQTQSDTYLTTSISRAIYSDADWKQTLTAIAHQLLSRLSAERFLLLQYNFNHNSFDVLHSSQPANRRYVTAPLSGLSDVDWQLVQRSEGAVAIENLEQDLRFYSWREPLLALGVRSLLVCNTSIGNQPEALVVIGHESSRSWSGQERELLMVVSQQLGLIVRQWQLHTQTQLQAKTLELLQHSLIVHSHTQDYKELERLAMRDMAAIAQVPLAVLLAWSPGHHSAQIATAQIANSKFAIQDQTTLAVESEALIQWAIAADGFLPLSVNDLPPATRQWLNGQSIGQLLIVALRTAPEHAITGAVVLADYPGRQWSEQTLNALDTLTSQLAWSRRYLKLTQNLHSKTEELQQLNWYKHRRLEEIQRSVGQNVAAMNEVGIAKDDLTNMRYQQLLRQLATSQGSIVTLVKQEQWQLHINSEFVPITTLLKRSLERVEELIKQRKLWSGVHGIGAHSAAHPNQMNVAGDIVKIELVIYELLVAAINRSHAGGRIDIWCRPLDNRFVEVSITDNGAIEPRLLAELQAPANSLDALSPSLLDQPPGLHLAICQQVIQQMSGELNFFQLEDTRVLSRLVLLLQQF